MAQTAKKNTESSKGAPQARKTQKNKKSTKGKKAKVLRLVDFLPEDERLEALRRAASRLDEVEQTQELLRSVNRLAEAYERLGVQLTDRLHGFEETTEERFTTARDRLRSLQAVQTVQELSERMSGRAVEELDEVLDQLGLMRKAVHEEEIELLKKRHKASRKAAETKARKAAEKELRAELKAEKKAS